MNEPHETYETHFRPACIERKLDTSRIDHSNDNQPHLTPGFQRLTFEDHNIRAAAWTMYFQDMVSFSCGPLNLDTIDWDTEQANYFIPDGSETHALKQKLLPNGDMEPMMSWYPKEDAALKRLRRLAHAFKLPSLSPDDYARVGVALKMMLPDFRAEWNEVYKHSKLVPKNTVTPHGKWPIISWALMKILMDETQELTQRDITKRSARLLALTLKKASHGKKAQPARDRTNPVPDGDICRICKTAGHIAKTCT
jgi:hypothetical protein